MSSLPEIEALERILDLGHAFLDVQVVATAASSTGNGLPVYCVSMGTRDQRWPAIGYFGGVHGLERIGTEVVSAFLHSLVMRLNWDEGLHQQLQRLRLVFMPIVNPGGMLQGTRANPQGVDLMRNAPIDAVDAVPFLVGGQRWSNRLPWYRGPGAQAMELESQALCTVVQNELWPRPFSLALDCHSGFGSLDRIWFPFAYTRKPIAHLADVYALKLIFEQSYSHHAYRFEPQSVQYLAHGDLWDYLYLGAQTSAPEHTFLPLTLEMGSWLWVKKNLRQAFTLQGLFNPLIAHRQHRVLRRHLALLDFLARASHSYARWVCGATNRIQLHDDALKAWYA